MARNLPLHPHLPTPGLSQCAREAPALVQVRRWQLLALVAEGKTVKDAAVLVDLN